MMEGDSEQLHETLCSLLSSIVGWHDCCVVVMLIEQ
jgi:hypothetical protein